MSVGAWDVLEAHLAELIFDQGLPVRKAIPTACQTYPETSVHYLVLSLSSAASALEDGWPLEDRINPRNLLDLYRAAAAVASDIAMHDILGQRCETCGQLLEYWRTTPDQFFDTCAMRTTA